MPFKILDHTADVAVKIESKTLEKLFEEAAGSYLYLLIEEEKLKPCETKKIKLEAMDHESLLVSFLSELIYILETQNKIPCNFKIKQLTKTSLQAEVACAQLEPHKISILCNIKAVTFYDLKIKKTTKGFNVTLVFDI